ncbi:N-acetyltransferase [Egibacter rhizosphaerae]|uniref:N-acetyltransferase n=1 Tax=Egibacter rhizosphaerae TaxID=1670831 RepID=A0A411YF44_9ACTN|nr:N-acetyltransferase [Egibacter rhizosphaerae]QBI19884.1 N-acetyltransferase [Egibacter rhizosphaerae]
MLIRRERADDRSAVASVHGAAFPTPEGANAPVEVGLLAELRDDPGWLPHLSVVAVGDAGVVGHAVCTRGTIEPEGTPALGLGPIAVLPEHQGSGIGSALMHTVLEAADARGEALVCLLGDPGYYRRFGFVTASELAIEAPDPQWGEYFQARPLAAYTPQLQGRFRYAPPFERL